METRSNINRNSTTNDEDWGNLSQVNSDIRNPNITCGDFNINLNEYEVVANSDGVVVLVEQENVFLQNIENKNILKVPHSSVSTFYGLEELVLEEPVLEPHPAELPVTFVKEEVCAPAEEVCSNSVPGAPSGDQIKWNNEMTKFLLDLCSKLMSSVGPLKKFRFKKFLWLHIASKLNEKFNMCLTSVQVETRYKCVQKRKKNRIKNERMNAAMYKEAPIDEEMCDIRPQNENIKVNTGLTPHKNFQSTIPYPRSSAPATTTNYRHQGTTFVSCNGVSQPNDTSSHSLTWADVEQDDENISRTRRRRTVQEQMFAKFLKQRDEQFQIREENKNVRQKEKLDHSKERHREKMLFLKEIFGKLPESS